MATHEGFVHVQDPSAPPAGASATKGWIFVDEDGGTEPAGTRSGIQLRDEAAGPAPGGEAEPAEDQNAAPAEDLLPKDHKDDAASAEPNGQPTPSDEEVTEGCGATIISAHVDAMLLACTEAAAKTFEAGRAAGCRAIDSVSDKLDIICESANANKHLSKLKPAASSAYTATAEMAAELHSSALKSFGDAHTAARTKGAQIAVVGQDKAGAAYAAALEKADALWAANKKSNTELQLSPCMIVAALLVLLCSWAALPSQQDDVHMSWQQMEKEFNRLEAERSARQLNAQALQARDIEYDCCTPARKEPAESKAADADCNSSIRPTPPTNTTQTWAMTPSGRWVFDMPQPRRRRRKRTNRSVDHEYMSAVPAIPRYSRSIAVRTEPPTVLSAGFSLSRGHFSPHGSAYAVPLPQQSRGVVAAVQAHELAADNSSDLLALVR